MSPVPRDIALTEVEIDQLLATSWLIRVATLSPGGRINLTPLWFAWVEGRIYSYCRGQKVSNLRQDSRLTLLVDRNERFPELQGVMLEGLATVLEDVAAEDADPYLTEARLQMSEKYAGGRGDPDAHDSSAVTRSATGRTRRWVRIEPTRIVSWDNKKLDRIRPRAGD